MATALFAVRRRHCLAVERIVTEPVAVARAGWRSSLVLALARRGRQCLAAWSIARIGAARFLYLHLAAVGAC